MKVKDLETALKYFIPIRTENDSPLIGFNWDKATDNEVDMILEEEKQFKKLNYVVDENDSLYYYTDYLVLSIGHSRRGQWYYILCHKDSLELSVLATKPDGDGGMISLPDTLYTMIQAGDIIL